MLMFGNPKLGTPIMQMSQTAGVDLPMRVIVYETSTGDVLDAFHNPASLAELHGLPADSEILIKMTNVLDKLTSKAISH